MRYKVLYILLLLGVSFNAFAQQKEVVAQVIVYKKIDTTSLKMEVLYPPKLDNNKSYPCAVFFFGGGWLNGNINQFRSHANYLSQRGMVCLLVDYRVKSRQNTTPFESLKDAKSAIRYIRKNAAQLHINKDLISASGGSAGGHLAAAAALIEEYNEPSDDLSVSAKPNALFLFNPVIDNGPGGYGYERINEAYKNFSPLHNIKKGAPPTLLFLGTQDKLIPVETAKYYQIVMEKVGSQCTLFLFEGEGHGFFNKKEFIDKNLIEVDKFLTALGYLNSK